MIARMLVANLHWKALSLLIAVALWFFVVGEPELVTSHSAPVFFKNLPRDLEISSGVPDRIYLELRGPAGSLAPGQLSNTAVLVDLAPIQGASERTFSVMAAGINLPRGTALLRAVPSQLRLRFEKMLSKEIPVLIRTGSPPPPGYRVILQEARPAKLRITGPESRVQAVDAAQTDPIDLGSVVGRSEFQVHAYVPDAQVRFDASPIVTVRVDVEKK